MEKFDYDKQIQELIEVPYRIFKDWYDAYGLFKFVGCENGSTREKRGEKFSGCLTMIKSSPDFFAYLNGIPDIELTEAIKADKRIPKNKNGITLKNLHVFKEWQEKIDALSD